MVPESQPRSSEAAGLIALAEHLKARLPGHVPAIRQHFAEIANKGTGVSAAAAAAVVNALGGGGRGGGEDDRPEGSVRKVK